MTQAQSKVNKIKGAKGSECASEYVDNADERRGVPFDSDGAIDLVVPEARSRKIESAIGFLHDDTVGDKLEVFIFGGDIFENLS